MKYLPQVEQIVNLFVNLVRSQNFALPCGVVVVVAASAAAAAARGRS